MTPPDRFAGATFETYVPQTPSQAEALRTARSFAHQLREPAPLWRRLPRWLRPGDDPIQGLYFVGPVGTGKTHLLAALYHALHPDVPCGFMHSSTLYRTTTPPLRFADQIADQFDALCLDEVEIDDPANEMRLVQLLRRLDARDVAVLATSNVAPDRFISTRVGPNRFERFLSTEFQQRYKMVVVRGDDYRRQHRVGDAYGKGWIGPAEQTRPVIRRTYRQDERPAKWWTFDAFREASRTTAHPQLMETINRHSSLYLADIALHDTDDALRLLRVIDDLYTDPEAPMLYFTAETPPSAWFEATAGIAGDIAEKFRRTVSRIHAMCTIERLPVSADS